MFHHSDKAVYRIVSAYQKNNLILHQTVTRCYGSIYFQVMAVEISSNEMGIPSRRNSVSLSPMQLHESMSVLLPYHTLGIRGNTVSLLSPTVCFHAKIPRLLPEGSTEYVICLRHMHDLLPFLKL